MGEDRISGLDDEGLASIFIVLRLWFQVAENNRGGAGGLDGSGGTRPSKAKVTRCSSPSVCQRLAARRCEGTAGLDEGASWGRTGRSSGMALEGARRRPRRVLGLGGPTCPSGQAGAVGGVARAPPPTRPLGGTAITLSSAPPPSLSRPSQDPLPPSAPPRGPLIGPRRGRSISIQGADWARGLRAAPSLLGLACCALAQRKRRPAEGALLLRLDGRGGGDEGSGAGGLARAAAVAAADGSRTARRAHGVPRQGRRHLRLAGRGAGARGARWAAAGAAAAPSEQRVGARRRGLGLGGRRKAGAARLIRRRYLSLPPARRKPQEEAA
ncbi:hypothetical protein HPG69_008575 [Diceros bicornis minor]|uniref:Uncharacterized protein n=1 Tax=Diceros bicornis minor TaxID=77932 RepID=A0A7J7FA74_DICBM|nr:hypothetical protein HPG69_008575 [Diceros bicornis minor]